MSRERTTANSTNASAENIPTNLRGSREAPRQEAADLDLILSVPAGTIPAGWTGHWFTEDRVQQKLAEWWMNVTDKAGVNITRTHKDKRMFLMAIETDRVEELNNLREKRYHASIGETESKAFEGKAEGRLEDYTPSGSKNNIRITKDVFDL